MVRLVDAEDVRAIDRAPADGLRGNAAHGLDTARAGRVAVTVPTAVVAEWWRARTTRVDGLLAMFTVGELTERLAKLAGEGIAAVPSATVVDAIVMASAASRSDAVYTSDVGDLVRLRDGRFPSGTTSAAGRLDFVPHRA